MWYITSGNLQSISPLRTLQSADRVLPLYTPDALSALGEQSFGAAAAQCCNRLFGCRMDARDVEFALGRSPMELSCLGHRVLAAEPWHNPGRSLSWAVRRMTARILGIPEETANPTQWGTIAVGIALLAGMFALLKGRGICGEVDLAVFAGDFTLPMAAYYARRMGLPVGGIICACWECSALWELFHRGEVSMACPPCAELLLYDCLGAEEAERFSTGEAYALSAEQTKRLRSSMSVYVIGQKRAELLAATAYPTGGIPGACAYAALQDHRACGASTRQAVVFSPEATH